MGQTSAVILSLSISLSAQDYPPPTSLVTIPTAGGLVRGAFSTHMYMQREGGLTAALAVGLTDRFMFGSIQDDKSTTTQELNLPKWFNVYYNVLW